MPGRPTPPCTGPRRSFRLPCERLAEIPAPPLGDTDGLPLISYNTPGDDLRVAHCDDAACTSATRHTLDSAGDVGFDTSVATGADGLGLISYHDATNGDLKVLHCGSVIC